jgi:hypothetical protein
MLNKKESNMNTLENLKKERTHWLKAYNNMRPFASETPSETLERREMYLNNYKLYKKQIKKIQRQQRKEG